MQSNTTAVYTEKSSSTGKGMGDGGGRSSDLVKMQWEERRERVQIDSVVQNRWKGK